MAQEEPRKKPIDLLFALEEERLRRRRDALDKKFQTTIQHIDEVAKINEECYKAKKAIAETAKGNAPPLPAAPTLAAPLRGLETPAAPAPPVPQVVPSRLAPLRSPWPHSAPLPRRAPKPKAKPNKKKK